MSIILLIQLIDGYRRRGIIMYLPLKLIIQRNLLFMIPVRYFVSTPYVNYAIPKKNKMPPRPKWLIVEEEIDEAFLKGGRGPGGQKINKSNSKVQLTHKPTGLVVTCQYSRSQEQNRKRAREILALKLDELQNPEGCRTAIVNDRKTKTKQSKTKKANKKYKVLDEERKKTKEEEHELLSDFIDIDAEFDTHVKSTLSSTSAGGKGQV